MRRREDFAGQAEGANRAITIRPDESSTAVLCPPRPRCQHPLRPSLPAQGEDAVASSETVVGPCFRLAGPPTSTLKRSNSSAKRPFSRGSRSWKVHFPAPRVRLPDLEKKLRDKLTDRTIELIAKVGITDNVCDPIDRSIGIFPSSQRAGKRGEWVDPRVRHPNGDGFLTLPRPSTLPRSARRKPSGLPMSGLPTSGTRTGGPRRGRVTIRRS